MTEHGPSSREGGKLGILGGTFDPPHIGHLIVAQDAYTALELDRILFIPAAVPPHKQGRDVTPAAVRMAMLEAAIAGDERFETRDLELRRPGPSYTVDTLRELRAADPDCALFLLIGADQYRALHTWKEPETICELAKLVVLRREGDSYRASDQVRAPDRDLEVTRIDVSSTEVRRRVAAGEPTRYLVPSGVGQIIEREGLYR